MNEPLRKAQAFGEEYIEQIPLRLTAAEMQDEVNEAILIHSDRERGGCNG